MIFNTTYITDDQDFRDLISGRIQVITTNETIFTPHIAAYLPNLIEINAPNLLEIPMSAFRDCIKLKKINTPKATAIGVKGLYHCNLTKVFFPEVKIIRDDGLRRCERLEKADLPKCNYIEHKALADNPALTTLILHNPTIVKLEDNTILANTAIANGQGGIYVPKSLIEQYKIEPNWSLHINHFKAIEDYPDIYN